MGNGPCNLSEVISLSGFVLDEETLGRLDALAAEIVKPKPVPEEQGTSVIDREFTVTYKKRKGGYQFDSLQALISELKSDKGPIHELRMQYSVGEEKGLMVIFENDGSVKLMAFSEAADLDVSIERLRQEIGDLDESFPSIVQYITKSVRLRKLIITVVTLSSLLLLVSLWYYFQAQRIGVNIDQSLLLEGNTYFTEVAKAIQSGSIDEKLNVLLRGNLRNFVNATDFIGRLVVLIRGALCAIAVSMLAVGVVFQLRRLYPQAFFAFGQNRKRLAGLRRQRDIWLVAILVAFVVNVLAGLFVAVIQ